MSVVLRLVPHPIRETISILTALLERARRGEVIGIAISFRDKHGHEHSVFTGPYNDPGVAAAAAMRMSMRLNELHDSAN